MLKFTPEVLYGVNALNIKIAHLIGDILTTTEGNISEILTVAVVVRITSAWTVCVCGVFRNEICDGKNKRKDVKTQ